MSAWGSEDERERERLERGAGEGWSPRLRRVRSPFDPAPGADPDADLPPDAYDGAGDHGDDGEDDAAERALAAALDAALRDEEAGGVAVERLAEALEETLAPEEARALAEALRGELALDLADASERAGVASGSLSVLESLARAAATAPPVSEERWASTWESIAQRTIERGAPERADGRREAEADAAALGEPARAERRLPDGWISGYLDGELAEADRIEADARLAASPELAAELVALGRVDRFAREQARVESPSAAAWSSAWQRIEARTVARERSISERISARILTLPGARRWTPMPVLAAAAGLLVAASVALTLLVQVEPGEQVVARQIHAATRAIQLDVEAFVGGAPDEVPLGLGSGGRGGQVEVLEVWTSGQIAPTLFYPEEESGSVTVLFN